MVLMLLCDKVLHIVSFVFSEIKTNGHFDDIVMPHLYISFRWPFRAVSP